MRTAILLIAVCAAAAPGLAQAQRIVCWTDDQGRRMCGDRVPPEHARQERQVYDRQGRIVQIKEREKTPEEVAEDARLHAQAEAEQRRAEEQARYDRFLLQTYGAPEEIEAARDARLRIIEGRQTMAEKAVADTELSLEGLQRRAQAQRDQGREPDARLTGQISAFERSLEENRAAVTRLRQERENIHTQFERDLARFRELRGEG